MARLNREIAAAARHPDFVRRCEEVGAEAVGSDAESFGTMVRAQSAKIRDLVVSVNLRPE
jgi:tripartite-type tricarboxylate transporter receptor subunit TctC